MSFTIKPAKLLGAVGAGVVILAAGCEDRASQAKLAEAMEELSEQREELESLVAASEAAAEEAEDREERLINGLKELKDRYEQLEAEKAGLEEDLEEVRREFKEYKEKYTMRQRTEAIGKRYERLKTETGRVFEEAVIRKVEDHEVQIRHRNGSATMDFFEVPKEWAIRFGMSPEVVAADFGREKVEAPVRVTTDRSGKAPKDGLPKWVLDAGVIIKGDAGTGSGFICEIGNAYYVYTAAHVLSGNRTLKIRTTDGRELKNFGYLEAADGADLVRLRLTTRPPSSLLIADKEQSGAMEVGTPIVAVGDSGGEGVLTRMAGKVESLGPGRIEVDAEVVQGSSGGPVLLEDSWAVVGLVTHGIAGREDVWNTGTRFSGVRRFACRVDGRLKWSRRSVGEFLAEGRMVEDLDRVTRLMFALGALAPSDAGMRMNVRVGGGMTILAVLEENKDMKVVQEIMALNTKYGEKKLGTSRRDLEKKYRPLYESVLRRSQSQMAGLSNRRVSWFHRQNLDESVEWRRRAEQAIGAQIRRLGR